MSATMKAKRQAKTAKATAAKPKTSKPAPKPAKPAPQPEPAEDTEYHGLVGIATRNRTGADGKAPAKHQIFEIWLRDPVTARADVDKIAKRFSVKPTTVRSWMSNWSQGLDNGGYYPASLRGREKDLVAALAKIAKANKA